MLELPRRLELGLLVDDVDVEAAGELVRADVVRHHRRDPTVRLSATERPELLDDEGPCASSARRDGRRRTCGATAANDNVVEFAHRLDSSRETSSVRFVILAASRAPQGCAWKRDPHEDDKADASKSHALRERSYLTWTTLRTPGTSARR